MSKADPQTTPRDEYVAVFGGPHAIGGTATIYKLNQAGDYSFFCTGIDMVEAKKVIRAMKAYHDD